MKIRLKKEVFLKKLDLASKFISSKLSSNTSLQGVYIKKDKEKIHFYSTNLNFYYHGFIKTEEEGNFQVVIEPKKISEFLSLLPPKDIDLEVKDKTVIFSQEKTKGEFSVFSSEDFPILTLNSEKKQKIDPSILKKTLPLMFFSASSDESRPVLTGVNFVSIDETTQIVTTDGFRLSLFSFKNDFPFSSVIIPSAFLFEISKLISEEKDVYFSFQDEEKTLTFYINEEEYTTRLIEGEYPPYEKVIPSESRTTIILNREDFLRNIRLISVFARDFSSIVILEVGEDSLKISPKTGENDTNSTSQDADIKGEKQRIAFNYKFLLDFLNNISSDKIIIELLRSDSPAVFKSDKNSNYLHIIMPVRIQE